MEASTATKTAPPDPAPEHDGAAEATRSTEELFQWSTTVNVGVGADECEHRFDGTCDDAKHFHAWLCLPNTFQARDIADKANAAKARMRRALTQPDKDGNPTDAALILEDGLSAWSHDDTTYDALLQTIANRNVERQIGEITTELADDEEWQHSAADLEEYRRLLNVPEDDRDTEEWERVQASLDAYRIELDKRATGRFEREMDVLKQTSHDEVVDMQRKWLIEDKAQEVWSHIYYTWAYFTCARKPTVTGYPRERIFDRPEDLKNCAPEVLNGLRTAYRGIESRMLVRSDASGN